MWLRNYQALVFWEHVLEMVNDVNHPKWVHDCWDFWLFDAWKKWPKHILRNDGETWWFTMVKSVTNHQKTNPNRCIYISKINTRPEINSNFAPGNFGQFVNLPPTFLGLSSRVNKNTQHHPHCPSKPLPSPRNFRYLKWRNPAPYKAILGVGFPLHKPYIQLI